MTFIQVQHIIHLSYNLIHSYFKYPNASLTHKSILELGERESVSQHLFCNIITGGMTSSKVASKSKEARDDRPAAP